MPTQTGEDTYRSRSDATQYSSLAEISTAAREEVPFHLAELSVEHPSVAP